MQGVVLKPGRKRIAAMMSGLCLLSLLMLALPPLCAPLALALPLLACPLMGQKEEPMAWVAAAMPAVSSLMEGYEVFYSLSLVLLGGLPMAVSKWLPLKKRASPQGLLWYIGAVAAALTVVTAAASQMLGGPLWQQLTGQFVERVRQSDQAGLILYRFAAAGLVSLPEGFAGSNVLMHVFEPLVIREMLLSLRLTTESLLRDLLPGFFVQACLIVGVFTGLRECRLHTVVLVLEDDNSGQKKARVQMPPGFGMLSLPKSMRGPLMLMAVLSLVLMLWDDPVTLTVAQLCYSTFEAIFTLAGAAVVVGLFSRKNPQRKTLYGVLTAALYLVMPLVLFVVGVMDQTFHFRVKRSGQTDS